MDKPQVSKPLTQDDEFYLEWGRETQKAGISVSVDTLQRLVSLNGTMLGGSLLLWQSIATASWMRPTCCGLFLIALFTAFWGILPHSDRVDLDDPASIKQFKETLLERRNRWVRVSAFLTSVAFILALIALGFAAANPKPHSEATRGESGPRD